MDFDTEEVLHRLVVPVLDAACSKDGNSVGAESHTWSVRKVERLGKPV